MAVKKSVLLAKIKELNSVIGKKKIGVEKIKTAKKDVETLIEEYCSKIEEIDDLGKGKAVPVALVKFHNSILPDEDVEGDEDEGEEENGDEEEDSEDEDDEDEGDEDDSEDEDEEDDEADDEDDEADGDEDEGDEDEGDEDADEGDEGDEDDDDEDEDSEDEDEGDEDEEESKPKTKKGKTKDKPKKDKPKKDKPKGKRPEKAGAPGKPGVIQTILDTITSQGPITKDGILKVLEKTFPDRDGGSMMKTINAQIGGKKRPTRMEKTKNVKFEISDKDEYSIEGSGSSKKKSSKKSSSKKSSKKSSSKKSSKKKK